MMDIWIDDDKYIRKWTHGKTYIKTHRESYRNANTQTETLKDAYIDW